jgi:hypothetical protein
MQPWVWPDEIAAAVPVAVRPAFQDAVRDVLAELQAGRVDVDDQPTLIAALAVRLRAHGVDLSRVRGVTLAHHRT